MTNQQGAPEALRLAGILDGSFSGQLTFYQVANELRRLAALVEAQQPAPLCTRSHPHEQMTWRCQVLSVVAELRNMEARGQEATEHELGRFADRLDVALQPAPSAAAVDECRRCVGTGRIDTGKGALGHEVYADCPDCQPSPTPQADSQPAPVRDDLPTGAIINGRALAERLENGYKFECEAGPLRMCSDWQEFVRCFDYLATWVENRAARAPADSVTAPAGGVVGIYVASRASLPERPAYWRALRAAGWPIVSTWIDEAGPGETADLRELWARIIREISSARGLVLHVETDDFPLKGALIEVGAALSLGKRVGVYAPGVVLEDRSMRPLGSWAAHPLVRLCPTLADAREWAESMPTPPAQAADSVLEDAARWQELRAQHEDDAAERCCVFSPNDMRECLVPVGSLPGELDAFIDAKIAARKQGANHD